MLFVCAVIVYFKSQNPAFYHILKYVVCLGFETSELKILIVIKNFVLDIPKKSTTNKPLSKDSGFF